MVKKNSSKKVEGNEKKITSDSKAAVSTSSKKSKKKSIPKAMVSVNCSYNNTIISFMDYSGGVFASSSGGSVGFKGSKKGTAFAATRAAFDAYEKASKFGVVEAIVIIKGVGMGRRSAVQGLRSAGLIITSLSDKTPVPHNGCRPRKKPRGS